MIVSFFHRSMVSACRMNFRKSLSLFSLIQILVVTLSNGENNVVETIANKSASGHFYSAISTHQNQTELPTAQDWNLAGIPEGNNATKSSKKREAGGDYEAVSNSFHKDEEKKSLYAARGTLPLGSDQSAIENRRGSLFKNIFQKPTRKPDLLRPKRPPYQYDILRSMYQPQIPIYDLRRAADMESSGTSDQMVTEKGELRTNAPFSVHPPISPALETSSVSDVIFLKNWHDQFGTLFSSEVAPQMIKEPDDNLIAEYKNHNNDGKVITIQEKEKNDKIKDSSFDFKFDDYSSLHDMVTDHFKHGKPNKDFGEKSIIDMNDAEIRTSSNFVREYIGNKTNYQDGQNGVIKIVGKPIIKDLRYQYSMNNDVNQNIKTVGTTYVHPNIISNIVTESIPQSTSNPLHYGFKEEVNGFIRSPTISQNWPTVGKKNKDFSTSKHGLLLDDQPPPSFQVHPHFQNPVDPMYSQELAFLPASQQLLPHKSNLASYSKKSWKSRNYPFYEPNYPARPSVKKSFKYGNVPPLMTGGYQPYVATNLAKDRIMYPRYDYYLRDDYDSPLRRLGNELTKEREASEFLAISGVALVGALAGYFLLNAAGPMFSGKNSENPIKVVVKGARQGLNKLVVALDEYEVNLASHELENPIPEKKLGKEEQLKLQEHYNLKIEENQKNLTRIFNDFFTKVTGILNAHGYVTAEGDHFSISNILSDDLKKQALNYSMDILVEAVLKDLEKKIASEATEIPEIKLPNKEALFSNLLQVSTTGQSAGEQVKSDILTEDLLRRIYSNNFIENLIIDSSKLYAPLTTPKNVVLVKELKFVEENNEASEEERDILYRNQKNIKDARNESFDTMTTDENKSVRQPSLRVVGSTLYQSIMDSPTSSFYGTKNMRFLQDEPNTFSRSNDIRSQNDFSSVMSSKKDQETFKNEFETESKQMLSSNEVAKIKSQIKKVIVNNEEQFVRKIPVTPADPRGRQLINVIVPTTPGSAGIFNRGVIIKNQVHVPALFI